MTIPREIRDRLRSGDRLDVEEIAWLLTGADLAELGMLAHARRMERADPARVTYIRDRNINYTNECISGCRFCAFFRKPGHAEGYVLSPEAMDAKIVEARSLGAVQILLQGGLHPDLDLDFYTGMLRRIRERHGIHVHGFSPPEVVHIATRERLSIRETIRILAEAGLGSIPGGGAEILTERSRKRVSPGKCTAAQWLEVMEKAHEEGLRTTATMMFGHGETVRERAKHLIAIRDLQDRTGGFTAFIPWSFQPRNTALAGMKSVGGHDYMRVLAVSRLALPNVTNIQVSWVTQGERVAQAALFFGANDFGSTMIEENVVAAAGVAFRLSAERIEALIRAAGFDPRERNQAYEPLRRTEDASR